MPQTTFGYWGCRGRANCLRLILAYSGEDWKDFRYVISEGTDPWFVRDKFNLGLDFPNIPYYMDGDLKLSETRAILRHIGRKYNLAGKTLQQQAIVDMAECIACDLGDGLRTLGFAKDAHEKKDDYIKGPMATKLKAISAFLAKNGNKWIAGNDLSFADFELFEYLDQHHIFDPTCFDGLPNLTDYMARFRALPKLKEYLQGDDQKHLKERFFAPWATLYPSK